MNFEFGRVWAAYGSAQFSRHSSGLALVHIFLLLLFRCFALHLSSRAQTGHSGDSASSPSPEVWIPTVVFFHPRDLGIPPQWSQRFGTHHRCTCSILPRPRDPGDRCHDNRPKLEAWIDIRDRLPSQPVSPCSQLRNYPCKPEVLGLLRNFLAAFCELALFSHLMPSSLRSTNAHPINPRAWPAVTAL